MRIVSVLIIACLATTTFATAEIERELVRDLQQFRKTDFGTNLVNSIELELNSGAAVDTLTKLVEKVRNNLKQQFSEAETAHNSVEDSCLFDMKKLNGDLSGAEANAENQEGLSTVIGDDLKSRIKEREDQKSYLKSVQTSVTQQMKARAREEKAFAAVKKEHRLVAELIVTVRDIVDSRLSAKGAFLELKTTMFMELSAKVRDFETPAHGLAHGYKGLFETLVQMLEGKAHGDQKTVELIQGLLDKIEANLDQSLEYEKERERERETNHEELMHKMTGMINDFGQKIGELKDKITTLKGQVRNANTKQRIALQQVKQFQTRLDDRKAECAAAQREWQSYFNTISAELSTAAKIVYLVRDKRELIARYEVA